MLDHLGGSPSLTLIHSEQSLQHRKGPRHKVLEQPDALQISSQCAVTKGLEPSIGMFKIKYILRFIQFEARHQFKQHMAQTPHVMRLGIEALSNQLIRALTLEMVQRETLLIALELSLSFPVHFRHSKIKQFDGDIHVDSHLTVGGFHEYFVVVIRCQHHIR